jgi:hypothetical protein
MLIEAAPMIHALIFATISEYVVGGVIVFLLTLIIGAPMAYVVGSAWSGVIKLRLKARLKQQVIALTQQMIERGMTANEIARILGPPSEALSDLSVEEQDDQVNKTFAGEAILERDGDWHPALVLRRDGDSYLVHTCPGYHGAEMLDNEWVGADRLQFPPGSSSDDGSPRGSVNGTAAACCGQPKKAPVPAEV